MTKSFNQLAEIIAEKLSKLLQTNVAIKDAKQTVIIIRQFGRIEIDCHQSQERDETDFYDY